MRRPQADDWGPGWGGIVTTLVALVILLAFLTNRYRLTAVRESAAGSLVNAALEKQTGITRLSQSSRPSHVRPAPATAEQIVAAKLAQFGRSRRNLAHMLAKKHHVQAPDDVERFFDAVESGNWDATEAAYKKICGSDKSVSHGSLRPPDINEMWSAISDAYGVAEQVHLWPAQELLDYGNAVLGSLRPGMAYVGGTDNGRWIPELLNDTSPGENHIVITQNGLADAKYLEYVTELYGDRMATLNQDDAQRAFQEYVDDAQKRLQHDQQFPDEPKQVLPGEDIKSIDGKVQVSGQVAVMGINERLLQSLLAKNPDMPFALEESFPLRGTYPKAMPLGPIMELRAQDAQNGFTTEQAAQSLNYWQGAAQAVLSDPNAPASDSALKSYSHDADAAANLLTAHGFPSEAQQLYRVAAQLYPGSPEATAGLAAALAGNGQENEAQQLLQQFARNYPDQQNSLDRCSASMRLLWSASPPAQ